MLLHPEVAFRDCRHCLEFFYEESGPNNGQVRVGKDGHPEPRPPGTQAPCLRIETGCPKGTAEEPIQLTEANWKLWQFYKRCKLTGQWPDDELLLDFSVALQEIEEGVREIKQLRFLTGVVAAASAGMSGRNPGVR